MSQYLRMIMCLDCYGDKICLNIISQYLSLTLCRPIEFSIQFNKVKSGWSIIYIEGPQVIISPQKLYFSLWRSIFFVLANSADRDEMPYCGAFHLDLHFLQKHPFRGFLYTMGWLPSVSIFRLIVYVSMLEVDKICLQHKNLLHHINVSIYLWDFTILLVMWGYGINVMTHLGAMSQTICTDSKTCFERSLKRGSQKMFSRLIIA